MSEVSKNNHNWRHLPAIVGAAALVFTLITFVYSCIVSSEPAQDTLTYLAAGARLNAGLPLYVVSNQVDRAVSYAGIPLISPPLIAVIFRPLATLPNDLGRWLWWLAQIGTLTCTLLWMLRDRRIGSALAVYLLAMPTGFEMAVGNMNGFIAAATILVWKQRRHPWIGAIVGVMTCLKLLPLIFVWWLVVQKNWNALRWCVAAAAASTILVVIGAGPQSLASYVAIAERVPPAAGSIAGLTGIHWASTAAFGMVCAVIWIRRGRPPEAFALACVGMIAGSPALNFNWLVLMLPAVAALADSHPRSARGSRLREPNISVTKARSGQSNSTMQSLVVIPTQ